MIGGDKTLQERHLDILVRNGAFQFTNTFFPYASGKIGPHYVQSASVMKGRDYFRACEDLKCFVEHSFSRSSYDVISGGESRDWIFSLPIARDLRKSHTMIYKDGRIIGADLEGKKAIHVADLNNEGSSPRDFWVPAIKKAGGEIENIFFYIDRMEDGVGVMKDLGLESQAVVKLDEYAWDYLVKREVVSEEIYRNLRERMEDRDAWAQKMLRSDKGFERLSELFNDPRTIEKAIKVVTLGYHQLRLELEERMDTEIRKNFFGTVLCRDILKK